MTNDELLAQFSKEKLIELIKIYSKHWLAMDGVWFQAVERHYGMDKAMELDIEIWQKFTVLEAKRIKLLLSLPEHAGLEGLERALRYRLYANINDYEIYYDEGALVFRTLECRVQNARERKEMPYHPCARVAVYEYGMFAETIDSRIKTECLTCYPDVRDATCCCSWRFSIEEK